MLNSSRDASTIPDRSTRLLVRGNSMPFRRKHCGVRQLPHAARRCGIGNWSEDEIARAIREGIRPDGQILGPPMSFVFYRGISDGDIRAIVAYLNSVPAVRNRVPRTQFNIP